MAGRPKEETSDVLHLRLKRTIITELDRQRKATGLARAAYARLLLLRALAKGAV